MSRSAFAVGMSVTVYQYGVRDHGLMHAMRLWEKLGSLVIPEIHNSMIFMANEECP